MDDCRHRGQGGVGQLSGSGQHQTGNIEEFPPLGRNGNDDTNHDQRGSLMQNAAFGGFSSTNTFDVPNTVQTRYGLPNAPSSQSDTSQSLQQKLEAIQARTAAIEEQVKVRQEEERRKRLDEKMAEELLSLRAMIKQAEEKEREVRRQLFASEIMYG
ncbi:hypothetical protein MMC22_008599 [Lobaria immixta]|nr:hypothetical protein [Lobaria immixta]